MDSQISKKTIMKRILARPPLVVSPLQSPLMKTLQEKIICYQNIHHLDLQKTYYNFLEIGNSPSKTASQLFIPARTQNVYRQSYNSLSLNDTKIMKKSMKSIKEYQKTLESEEESESHIRITEGTLIRNFSLAKFILEETIENFKIVVGLMGKLPKEETESSLFKKNQNILKFHRKCETLKENIRELLLTLDKEKDIPKMMFEKSICARRRGFEGSMLRSIVQSPHGYSVDFKTKIEEAFRISKVPFPFHDLTIESVETPLEDSIKIDSSSKKPMISFFQDGVGEENPEKKSEAMLKSPKSNIHSLLENFHGISTRAGKPNKLQNMKETYDKFLTDIIILAYNLNMRELYVALMLLHAKICMEFKEIYKSVAILKQAKSISNELGFVFYRLKCYEKLGKASQILKNFNGSLRYFLKMLESAFICDCEHKELQAYDLIGVQFYYQGQTEIADFFHKRLLDGEIEPVESNLRIMAKRKYNKRSKVPNYVLPSYIAARNTTIDYEALENDSSDEEKNDLRIENLMGKYHEKDRYWRSLIKKTTGNSFSGPVNLKEVLEKANKNIRPAINVRNQRMFVGLKDITKRKRVGGISADLAEKNAALRFNHLSPNRNFSKPNIYEFKMNKLSKEDSARLNKKVILMGERLYDKILRRIQGLFEKLRNNLRVCLMQIEFYLTKLRNSTDTSKRKKGLFCSPLLRKSITGIIKRTNRESVNRRSIGDKV